MRHLISIFFVFILFNCGALDNSVYCNSCNVKHGSFSIIRHQDKCLVVDCGAEAPNEWISESNNYNLSFVQQLLQGVTSIKIVITHDHDDHKNLLSIFTDKEFRLVKDDVDVQCLKYSEIHQKSITNNDDTRKQELEAFLNGSLGENVLVSPVITSKLLESNDDNFVNLVLVINAYNRKILFTGDANGDLLYNLRWNDDKENSNNIKLMRNINVFMVPHHGSILNGELDWLNFLRGNCFPRDNRGFSDFIGIISCNPETSRTSYGTIYFFPKNSENDIKKTHYVSFWFNNVLYSQRTNSQYWTNDPIFTTDNSLSNFYKITISENATISVCDGEDMLYISKKTYSDLQT